MESPSPCSVESISFARCVYEIRPTACLPSHPPTGEECHTDHSPCIHCPADGYLGSCQFGVFWLLPIKRRSCLHVNVCRHFSWGNTQRRACRAIEKRIFNLIKPARLFPKWLRYFSPYHGGGLFAGVGNSLRITQQKEFRGNSADSSWCGKGNRGLAHSVWEGQSWE